MNFIQQLFLVTLVVILNNIDEQNAYPKSISKNGMDIS